MKNLFGTLLDPIEKLITEHGSAVIQERHISLLKTQFAILEKKIIELEAQVQKLETENQRLNLDVTKKDQKIQILEKQIEEINTVSDDRGPGWEPFT